ncbi:glycosyltransferase family 2 protein [Virgibacillus sp. AGTR]|uniref:glycosyltransferase n=1 Tax=unclassified Virgibacillus TaxID=2620237 RepID=UPI000EF4AD2B|nr:MULTISPECIES: glycosyltransferase [unclassified Virgibacillus]MCC2248394.1 glycosyltransferase family 2 protein [Virgibacillus sp. AGTR]QRZ16743.1 glycosyltransferase family 2 protein [Virgibacillus sp. AGTR]
MKQHSVLIGSPIHQEYPILKEFLTSLSELKQTNITIHYMFVDDNTDKASKQLLRNFAQDNEGSTEIIAPSPYDHQGYSRNGNTHIWNHQAIWKVAEFKNQIIKQARDKGYDYLFLIDSDLLIHPNTIEYLIRIDKNIISTIFWTKWQINADPLPQVWVQDEYTLYHATHGERLSDEEKKRRTMEFINQLKVPGTYEVGGLGACTLLSAHALNTGVNFSPIPNLSFWGEDRHFCIRAQALGLSLYVDTHYPAYHIYRSSDLEAVEDYKDDNQERISPLEVSDILAKRISKDNNNKITLSMIMKNEASRYLKKVLLQHRDFIDSAVIIDDGSEDNSIEVCKQILAGIPTHIVQNKRSTFANEVELRKQQWEETIKTKPDWILNLDADELLEDKATNEIRELINQSDIDLYSFRLYDMWDEEHYRDDNYWQSHLCYRPFLLRYQPNFDYQWKKKRFHCGRFPANIYHLPNAISRLRIKHFGWTNAKERQQKYNRYLELDPDSEFGWNEQYQSILDAHPRLIKWQD